MLSNNLIYKFLALSLAMLVQVCARGTSHLSYSPDEQINHHDEIAILMEEEINPKENILEQCHRYYYIFTLPERVTPRVIKKVARMPMNEFDLQIHTRLYDKLRRLERVLAISNYKEARDVAKQISYCLDKTLPGSMADYVNPDPSRVPNYKLHHQFVLEAKAKAYDGDGDDAYKDQQLDRYDDIAVLMNEQINPKEDVLRQCHRYYYIFTLRGKVTPRVIEKVARMPMDEFNLQIHTKLYEKFRRIERVLAQSNDEETREVAKQLSFCLDRTLPGIIGVDFVNPDPTRVPNYNLHHEDANKDKQLNHNDEIAALMRDNIDSKEKIFNQCHRYYYIFTLPKEGKITQRVVEKVASMSMEGYNLQIHSEVYEKLRTIQKGLIQSGNIKAQQVGDLMKYCLDKTLPGMKIRIVEPDYRVPNFKLHHDDEQDYDKHLDNYEEIASLMKDKINSEESTIKQCQRYYYLFTLPEKVTQRMIEKVARMPMDRQIHLEIHSEMYGKLRGIEKVLAQSENIKAQQVATKMKYCLEKTKIL